MQTSGENSIGHPIAPQFVAVDQLGEALKQVQEAVIKGVCEQMKVTNSLLRAEGGSALEGSIGQRSGVRPPPQRTPIGITPSKLVATPYASREQEATWYMEQEESSHPPRSRRERTAKRNSTQGGFTGRRQMEERRSLSWHHHFEREELGRDPQQGNTSRRPGEPSLLDVALVRPITLKVGNSMERGSRPTYVTPFSREILEAPRLSKVKVPSVDLFDGTTDPDDHLDVYKAQMYVQDVDDATCYRYFPATLKGIAQKWFNGLQGGV